MVLSVFVNLFVVFQAGPAPRRPPVPFELFRRIDRNEDGKISQDEWRRFFKAADRNRDGFVTKPEWILTLRGGRGAFDPAPKAGDPAPKVKAKSLKDGKIVDLSKLRRTTVLIFGSYT